MQDVMNVINLTDQYWGMMLEMFLLLFLLGALAGSLFGRWWANSEWLDRAGTNRPAYHDGYTYRVTRECDEQVSMDKEAAGAYVVKYNFWPDRDKERWAGERNPFEVPFPPLRSTGWDETALEAGADPIHRVVPAREGRGDPAAEDEHAMGIESWRGRPRSIRS